MGCEFDICCAAMLSESVKYMMYFPSAAKADVRGIWKAVMLKQPKSKLKVLMLKRFRFSISKRYRKMFASVLSHLVISLNCN